jgi:DNA polymerase-3 subunit epsilon
MSVNLGEILALERPLAVVDLETTGLNSDRDRIVQMAITVHYRTKAPIAWETLVNPEISIPINSTRSHGITNAMVMGAPIFKDIAVALAPKMVNCDIAGFNVEFDIRFLRAEMKRANVTWEWDGYMVDALNVYRRLKPHNLQAAFKEFVDDAGFEGAHSAPNDVNATTQVLHGQLMAYPQLPRTVKELSDYCFPRRAQGLDKAGKLTWAEGHAVFTFGKWKDTPLHLVDVSYLQWCMGANFSEDFKLIVSAALLGNFPKEGGVPEKPEEQPF